MNATQAAIRAGYSIKAAQEVSSRLLSNAMVSKAVAKAQAAIAKRLEVSAERVVREFASIGFASIPNDDITVANKLAALDSLAKHLNLYVTRHEVTGPDGRPLQMGIVALDLNPTEILQLQATMRARIANGGGTKS
jgi:phage terminase small subunit